MSNLKISVLDVGHGDFIYAESPKGHTLVIDCGLDGGDVSPAKFLSRVSTIDELQISHPHTDHLSEIAAMRKKTINSFRCVDLARFKDESIGWRTKDAAAIKALREMQATIAKNDAAVATGDSFEHNVFVPGGIDYTNPNTASLITVLRYGSFKMLFGGDLPSAGWESLLAKPDFVKAITGTDVLKVSHHGRKEGCCDALFEVITPSLCVISDKSIDESNKNTVCTSYYSSKSKGITFKDVGEKKALTTRTDGSVHFQATGSQWWVWRGTTWVADDYAGE